MSKMVTEARKYVLYNHSKGKFRSNKKNPKGYGSFAAAIIYKSEHYAKMAAKEGDVHVCVVINISEEDIFFSILGN